jgi:tetratricopeptide (TPR) repeat protein
MNRFNLAIFALMGSMMTACPKKGAQPDPTDPIAQSRYLFVQGVKTLNSPDRKTGLVSYDTAYANFNEASELNPSFPNAHYNAGWSAEQIGQKDNAERHYRKAYEKNETNDFLFALADVLVSNDKSDEAVGHYQAFLAKDPKNKDVRYSLITALSSADRHDEAVQVAQEALMEDPEDVTIYRLLSRNYFAQGQFDMSLLCAEKASDISEGDAGIFNNMGVTHLEKENEAEAILAFKDALAKDPSHPEANLNMGFLALNSGNYSLANKSFDSVLTKHPSNLDAMLGKAVAVRGLGDYKSAEGLYEEILKSDNKSKLVFFNAATLQEKYLQNYGKALKILEEYKAMNAMDVEVDERIARVQESKRIEEERKAEEDRKQKEAEERAKRQQEQFDDLKSKVAALEKDVESLRSCEAAMETVMEAEMYLEQGQMVIEMADIEMAGDVAPFMDEARGLLEAVKPACEGGGAALPPADPAEEAPAEEAPAEEAPAEEAPAEEAAPEEVEPTEDVE